jgi:hypothetical protein
MAMFVGCFNLCFQYPRLEKDEEQHSLFSKKYSALRMIENDSPLKLVHPGDKEAMEKWLVSINRSIKAVSGLSLEFRILNPNEEPIRNGTYVRYRLQIFDLKTGKPRWDLYLIVVEDAEGKLVYHIRKSQEYMLAGEPDWIFLENIMRTIGYSVSIHTKNDKPLRVPISPVNAM